MNTPRILQEYSKNTPRILQEYSKNTMYENMCVKMHINARVMKKFTQILRLIVIS